MNRKEMFIRALNTFIQRHGENLKKQDIEPIVMNLAYLEVLKANKAGQSINVNAVLLDYARAANESFPQLNFQAEVVMFGYQATLQPVS